MSWYHVQMDNLPLIDLNVIKAQNCSWLCWFFLVSKYLLCLLLLLWDLIFLPPLKVRAHKHWIFTPSFLSLSGLLYNRHIKSRTSITRNRHPLSPSHQELLPWILYSRVQSTQDIPTWPPNEPFSISTSTVKCIARAPWASSLFSHMWSWNQASLFTCSHCPFAPLFPPCFGFPC